MYHISHNVSHDVSHNETIVYQTKIVLNSMAAKKGQKKAGGRTKGTPNKATADIKAIAQEYGVDAIGVLKEIMMDKKKPAAARVNAADKLMDRAFGKAPQAMTVKTDRSIIFEMMFPDGRPDKN